MKSGIDIKPSRQSNMELCRLFAMFLVLIVHLDFMILGSGVTTGETVNASVDTFLKFEFENLGIICVDLFILISGYFGIRPTRRGVWNIVFQVLFWNYLFAVIGYIIGYYNTSQLLNYLIPDTSNWFVPCYLMLMFIAPFINSHVERISRKQLLNFIIIFYVVQTIYGFVVDSFPFKNGYSFPSFIGLYLLGRYAGKYNAEGLLFFKKAKTGFLQYFTISTGVVLVVMLLVSIFKSPGIQSQIVGHMVKYVSPVVVYCALIVLMAFSKIKLQSRFINWCASSCFAIFLIHTHSFVINHIRLVCSDIYSWSPTLYWPVIIVGIILLMGTIICIDQIRILIWNKCFVARFKSLRPTAR